MKPKSSRVRGTRSPPVDKNSLVTLVAVTFMLVSSAAYLLLTR